MIRFTLKDSVLTAILDGKLIGSYKLGADSCTIGSTEHPILGCDDEKKQLDFLIYIEDEFYAKMLEKHGLSPKQLMFPRYWIVCTAGHTFEKTIFHPLGLKTYLRELYMEGLFKARRNQCPECLYLSQ